MRFHLLINRMAVDEVSIFIGVASLTVSVWWFINKFTYLEAVPTSNVCLSYYYHTILLCIGKLLVRTCWEERVYVLVHFTCTKYL